MRASQFLTSRRDIGVGSSASKGAHVRLRGVPWRRRHAIPSLLLLLLRIWLLLSSIWSSAVGLCALLLGISSHIRTRWRGAVCGIPAEGLR